MEIAKDINQFIRAVSESLLMGQVVHYDLQTLSYSDANDNLCEYEEYLDMDNDEFEKALSEELNGWQGDWVKEIREASSMPDSIEAPPSWQQIDWMKDFINIRLDDRKFINDATNALNYRHPFQAFKEVLHRYNLEEDWYAYQAERCEQYVADAISPDTQLFS